MTKNIDKIATHPLQTTFWAEFRKKWGNEVLETKFGVITLHKIPYTKYKIGMFIKGPAPSKEMFSELKSLAGKHNLIFIKMEPNVIKTEKLVELMKVSGAVPGKTLFTPTTFWINLKPNEDEILKSFHPKTRYNIRVAQRNKVVVQEDSSSKAFERYLELTRETVQRQGFYAHTEKYHRLMWETLHKEKIAHLLTATYQGEIITTWVLFVWKDFLYYPYGASTETHKNVMANNLMMWEAIKFGKKMGLNTFDLWGREEGKGFTKFKEGYNPKVVEFLGTWDFVTSPKIYKIYRIAESARWAILKGYSKINKSKSRF